MEAPFKFYFGDINGLLYQSKHNKVEKKTREKSENITQSGDLHVILDFEDAKIGQSLQTQIRRQRVNTRREPW